MNYYIEMMFWTKWKEARLTEAIVAFARGAAFQEKGDINLALKEINIGTSKMELIF